MLCPVHVQETTRGFAEDIALRKHYEKEGFGLETVFDKQEWAEDRVLQLRQSYGLTDGEFRLVKHISTPETGQRPTWEVYVKAPWLRDQVQEMLWRMR